VVGVVAAITAEGVAVDVGAKYEGLIPRAEFANDEELPALNQPVEVMVMHVDEDNGVIRLSKKRADYERIWRQLEEARDRGEVVTAMVTERVKGGPARGRGSARVCTRFASSRPPPRGPWSAWWDASCACVY
jgi:small subunit ribosomal protein S1